MRSFLVVVSDERLESFAHSVAALGGIQIDVVVFECAPQSLDENVVYGSSCPSIEIATPASFKIPVKTSDVNWLSSTGGCNTSLLN
jgi:hypothetical protein